MQAKVFVVYKHVLGACNALFIYAICSSEGKARIARIKAAGFKKKGKFYDRNPACSPYAAQIRILKVQLDCLYDFGVLESGGRVFYES